MFTANAFASLRATRGQGRTEPPTPATAPFRVATEVEVAACEPLWRRATGTPAGTAPAGSADREETRRTP